MPIFRGSKDATVKTGEIVATTGDIAEVISLAQQAEANAESSAVSANQSALLAEGYETGAEQFKDYSKEWAIQLEDVPVSIDAGGNGTDEFSARHYALKAQEFNAEVTPLINITDDIEAVSEVTTEISGVYSDLAAANFITDFGSVAETATVPAEAGTGYIVTVHDNLDSITSVAENIDVLGNADVILQETIDARDKAQLWAEENEDVEVEPGQFSSKHYALKSEDSATAAALSETDAETAASNALTSENNAAASESAALTSEQNAATSESNALTSEQNAAQSESNAADSETSALQAATDAETALDNFTDQYLGPKSSDPATDNDGDPLVEGTLYYNTADNQLKIYNGSGWVQAAFSVDGAVTSFNGREGPVTLNSTDVENALGYNPQDESLALAIALG